MTQETHLSGSEFYALRQVCGMSLTDFGRALGYTGSDETVIRDLRRLELLDQLPWQVERRISSVFKEAAARNPTRKSRPRKNREARP